MIFWFDGLYMDDTVRKHEKRCRKTIEQGSSSTGERGGWRRSVFGKSYFVVALARNEENLFEIMNTNQMFFRYYRCESVYILGVAKDYDGAVEIFRYIMTKGYEADRAFDPRAVFTKDKFVSAGTKGG